jgi:hypothetical protein
MGEGRGEAHIEFWWEDPRKGDHLEDPGIDGRIILKWIFDSGMEGMDWIYVAQDRCS